MSNLLKVFIMYSSADRELKEELEKHLQPLVDLKLMTVWTDKEIYPGEKWDAKIRKNLDDADIFLMLISIDFYNSGYIKEEEFKTATEKLESGLSLVIPIIVRHCIWRYFPVIKDLQVLPVGGIPITDVETWTTRDKAWAIVVEKIAVYVERVRNEKEKSKSNLLGEGSIPKNFKLGATEDIKIGTLIYHQKFGMGKVLKIEWVSKDMVAEIQFITDDVPTRRLVVKFAKLYIEK